MKNKFEWDWRKVLAIQNQFLSESSSDASLKKTLCKLTDELDHLDDGHAVTVLLMSPEGLRPTAGSRIPKEWVEVIDPLPLGDHAGSCGTAGFFKKLVIVENILTDPLWADYRELQPLHGFLACWSQPIVDKKDNVLGTFAVYFYEARKPEVFELDVIKALASTVGIIIERKKNEEALVKARKLADKANLAKSDFLSSMSHELRTPLNGILGFAQLLEYDPSHPLTATQKDNTDQIMKSGHHLLELIDQVLELAQIEAGKISMNIEDVALSEILDESVPLIAAMADKRGITLDINSAGCEGGFVRADHTRLKQIILNLLSNIYGCVQKSRQQS